MGVIRGKYVWSDDSLRPGKKSGGGLSQNLYDTEGNLRAGATFIPSDEDDEPMVVTETVYVPTDERREPGIQDAIARAVVEALAPHVEQAVRRGGAVVAGWWKERASAKSRARAAAEAEAEPPSATDVAVRQPRPQMSSAEAQARRLAALAARAFSDEQMRLIDDADVIGAKDDGRSIDEHLLELPSEQITRLVEMMATTPRLLEDQGLADLASYISHMRHRQRHPELP